MSEATSDEKPRRIWIVDDSPMEATFTQRALGNGYEFELFNDGTMLVERLSASADQPDAVLLDWTMPGMSGDEVCRFLRSQPATKELPIILVTASRVETSDIVTGLSLGANDYVARPFAAEELRARVDSVIRVRRAAVVAARERRRLATVNHLGRALFKAGTEIPQILEVLASAMTDGLCDGCSILLLPGELPEVFVARHRGEPSATALSAISSVADPVTHAFESSSAARTTLPPAYHAYIDRFGLRGLAILPFPILSPVQGVVTVTRDGGSEPFDADDLAMIETCIEYAALGVQKALRFETERLARDQLNSVLEHLPVGIIASNDGGTITLVNSAARAMVPGLEQARSVDEVWALAEWQTPEGQRLDQGTWPGQREIVMRRGALEKRFATTTVPLRRSGSGEPGLLVVLEDVTLERAAAHDREELARFTQRLLGIVGHDLRSPLGAFVAGLAMLDMRVETPTARPILARLNSSARRMTRIVDQLLDVTRATLGSGIQIDRREANLTKLVQSVIDEIRAQTPDAAIQLASASALEPTGRWDPERLAQVVSNLLTNALHYGAPGAPVVIELGSADDQATLSVKNQLRDRPIPPEVLAVLFDPHRRGEGARHNAAGLGLGLYIVQQIVHAHRGVIVAHSDDTGTEFRVTIPRS